MKKSTQLVWLIIFVIALLAVNILRPVWTVWAWRTTGRKFWLGLFCFCCLGLVLSLITLGMALFA